MRRAAAAVDLQCYGGVLGPAVVGLLRPCCATRRLPRKLFEDSGFTEAAVTTSVSGGPPAS
jgi:hypothetical protein